MFNTYRPQPPACLCPPGRPGGVPCPDINLEIHIESVVNGNVPGQVIITYVVIDTVTNTINTDLLYTWSVPSGHPSMQDGLYRMKVTYDGSGGQIVVQVSATIPNRTECDYFAIYTQPPCIDPVITFEVSLDCDTNLITITACVNGNCNYDPNYLYQWYLPNAVGVQFLQPHIIRLPSTQTLTDCTLEYLLFLFDIRTGCRTRQLIRRNVCDAPLLDECCNQPILSSLCSLWLICPPPNGCTVDIEVNGIDYFNCTQGLGSITGYGDVVDVILLGGNHYIFRVLCNGRFTVRVCANAEDCLCPTTLIDGGALQPDRIVLGTCAEWDLSTAAGSSRVVTIGTCAPCAPPYDCTQLPPQPPNTYLIEMVYGLPGFVSSPCSNIISGSIGPVFLAVPGFIQLAVNDNSIRVLGYWVGQGDTLRIAISLNNPIPIPTLGGLAPNGFHLGNPLNPYWDVVATGNLLIRINTSIVYTPSLPATTIISIDPC